MNRFCSIFSQLLQLFPRWEFQQLVLETKAERHARGFSSWGQFVAMLFCQLAVLIACGRSAEVWLAVKENCIILESLLQALHPQLCQ